MITILLKTFLTKEGHNLYVEGSSRVSQGFMLLDISEDMVTIERERNLPCPLGHFSDLSVCVELALPLVSQGDNSHRGTIELGIPYLSSV